MLAQSTSQYYMVLQNLRKALPSTSITVYYKPCTKYPPVLFCTTKLSQGITFVLQWGLHKEVPSTTLYYKACTRHFPVYTTLYYKACTRNSPLVLCTTMLAQGTSQYFFVLQRLRSVLPSATLHFTLHTPHFSLHTSSHFTLHNSHFTLHSPHPALHTSHFTPDTRHYTLHTPRFTFHT